MKIKMDDVKPNAIDRMISYVAPGIAARRLRARAFMALTGAYIGASTVRRQTKNWFGTAGDADADSIYDLNMLRMRSRDSERNNPLACGIISGTTTNVVGTGLKLKCRIDQKALNMTEDEAQAWQRKTEREFALWAESTECDAARTLVFYGHQELAFRQTMVNGDVFYLYRRFNRGETPYTLRLQAIEADRIQNKNFEINRPGMAGGVEKDEFGAPVAYHIMRQHPGNILNLRGYEWDIVPAFGPKTGLKNVNHLFRMLRPDQSRGIPMLAPVLEPLKQLDRYTEAELMATVISSMFTVFIKSEGGGIEGIGTAGTAPVTGQPMVDKSPEMTLGTGKILELLPGESVDTANPSRPNSQYDAFTMSILRQIGVSLEIPFEILIKHFTSSYSAARAALLEAWKFYKSRRYWLAVNFCQPTYENWLYEAVAIGRIQAPGFFTDPMVRKAYSGARWIGDAPGSIDPWKEANASEKRLDLAITTVDEETTMQGGDFEDNIGQIRKERKILTEIGLWQPVQNEKGGKAAQPEPQFTSDATGKEQ
jgi:lambda family phage portal protein